MEQIGYSVHNYTLSVALERKKQLRPEVLKELGPWLEKQGFGR